MSKKCHQQINNKSHRHMPTMAQEAGEDVLNVWKTAEKVNEFYRFIQFQSVIKYLSIDKSAIFSSYHFTLQKVRAQDVQFHRRQHLRRAAKWKSKISQESTQSQRLQVIRNRKTGSHVKEPDVPMHLLQFLRSTIILLQRQVYYLEVLNNISR